MPQQYFNWKSSFFKTDASHLWFAQINLHSWNYVILDSLWEPECPSSANKWITTVGFQEKVDGQCKSLRVTPACLVDTHKRIINSFPPFWKSREPKRPQGVVPLHWTGSKAHFSCSLCTIVNRESLKQEAKNREAGQVPLPSQEKTIKDRKPKHAQCKQNNFILPFLWSKLGKPDHSG